MPVPSSPNQMKMSLRWGLGQYQRGQTAGDNAPLPDPRNRVIAIAEVIESKNKAKEAVRG